MLICARQGISSTMDNDELEVDATFFISSGYFVYGKIDNIEDCINTTIYHE